MTISASGGRVAHRRHETIETALDLAVEVMTERGAGGLTISEVARRMGMRPPSLYKYFPSLHALYDALFVRATRTQMETIALSTEGLAGLAALRACSVGLVRLAVENRALAELASWRPVPEFEPSADAMQLSVECVGMIRSLIHGAVRSGELKKGATQEDAVQLLSIVMSGVITQQLANQPGVPFEDGSFTRLTERALDLFFDRYTTRRGTDAKARS